MKPEVAALAEAAGAHARAAMRGRSGAVSNWASVFRAALARIAEAERPRAAGSVRAYWAGRPEARSVAELLGPEKTVRIGTASLASLLAQAERVLREGAR